MFSKYALKLIFRAVTEYLWYLQPESNPSPHICETCGQMLPEGKNIPGMSRDWLTETKSNNRVFHFYL